MNTAIAELEKELAWLLISGNRDAVKDIARTIYEDYGSSTTEKLAKIVHDCVEVSQ